MTSANSVVAGIRIIRCASSFLSKHALMVGGACLISFNQIVGLFGLALIGLLLVVVYGLHVESTLFLTLALFAGMFCVLFWVTQDVDVSKPKPQSSLSHAQCRAA